MTSPPEDEKMDSLPDRPSLDLQTHLAALEAQGLLVRIDHPINKDTELHPLVRCQYLGGIAEDNRRAFLFTHVVDSAGRRYGMPVVVAPMRRLPGSIPWAWAGRSTTSAPTG